MALFQVLNVLRLYLETGPLPKYEMQEGARETQRPLHQLRPLVTYMYLCI